MLFVTCKKKNNLRWSGRPRTCFMYLSRAILTSSLRHWKIFVRLIFVVVGHWRNIFNDENFLIYGILFTKLLCIHVTFPKRNSISPKVNAILSLRNVTYFSNVAPSNQMPHPLSLHPLYFMLFKFKDLVAKQQYNKTAANQQNSRKAIYQTMNRRLYNNYFPF